MGDVPSEWVEKAESALNEATCVHRERGFAITCPPCDARAVLAAVLPDVRRAVAEEVIERVCAACLSLVAVLKGEDGVPLHAIPLAEFNEAVDRIAREVGERDVEPCAEFGSHRRGEHARIAREAATDPTEAT